VKETLVGLNLSGALMLRLLSALTFSIVSGAALAAGPHDRVSVGNWNGGSFSDDKSGLFSYCMASTPYKSGIHFSVAVTKKFSWDLVFFHPEWRLSAGERIPITMIFDGHSKFDFQASAISPTMVMIPMPDNSRLIQVFRQSVAMKAYAKGNEFPFRLDGTSRLIPALVQCTRDSIAKYGDSPVASGMIGSTLPNAANTPPSSTQLDIEALKLATNFLLKAQIPNAKVLSRDELPTELASYNSAWRADGIAGAVKIIPTSGDTKGIDIAARVAGEDARECKGKFASGRTSELVDSDVMFRGFSSCEDSQGLRSSQYFIIPRKKSNGFVIFSVTAAATTNGSSVTQKDEKISDFRKAAFEASQ
jgi:hypothetical protein